MRRSPGYGQWKQKENQFEEGESSSSALEETIGKILDVDRGHG